MPQIDEYISMEAAAELMGVSKRTLRRHCRGQYGVTLRTARIGRKTVTTKKWTSKFVKEFTEKSNVVE